MRFKTLLKYCKPYISPTALASVLLPLALLVNTQALSQTTIKRISVPTSGTQLNTASGSTVVSPGGKFAVFVTADNTLFPNDVAGTLDYVHVDLSTGALKPVTLGALAINNPPLTGQPPFSTPMASLSADGNLVAFSSEVLANTLKGLNTAVDTNNAPDIFVRDMTSGDYELISDTPATGLQAGNSSSYTPRISADGRYVVFFSFASDLAPNIVDANAAFDVFLYDRQQKLMTLVSIATTNLPGNFGSYDPTISDDGKKVSFSSDATDLVTNDNNNTRDIFVRTIDPFTPSTALASVDSATPPALGNGFSTNPSISADGRYVAFLSQASNLVGGDTGITPDVFVRDLQANKTSSFSVGNTTYVVTDNSNDPNAGANIASPAISKDGGRVAFTGFPSGNNNPIFNQIYFVERNKDTGAATSTKALSTAPESTTLGNGHSHNAGMSADGSVVVFESLASNLVSGDTNTLADAFKADAVVAPPLTASITASMPNAAEPSTNGEFTITLSTAPTSNVTVNYAVSGTATADTDYTTLPGTATVNSGSTTVKIPVTVKDDTTQESSETVIVTLSAGTGYTVGTPANATVNIADNDGGPPPPVNNEITNIRNLSTKGPIDATGMKAGFIVEKTGRFAILAEGEGVSPIQDPVLTLTGQFIDANGQIQSLSQSNDNWDTANSAELQQIIGRLPNSTQAGVLVLDLRQGLYTATIQGKNGETGTGIVALNQAIQTELPHLRNISTLGPIDTGSGMRAGFILTKPGRYAIIAEGNGPSAISDSVLTVTGGSVSQSNDDWNMADSAELQRITGRVPNSAKAAALVLDLPAGAFIAAITGKNGETGTGIIAITEAKATTP